MVTLLPAMLADLGLAVDRIEQATPILTGFLAGYVAGMPLVGAASDARGRGPVLVGAALVFVVGSGVTAFAGGLEVLVVGRALQGLGGGAMVPVGLALAADVARGQGRSPELALGGISALQEAGSVLGPLYGTAMASLLSGWRPVFWLSALLVLGVVGVILVGGRRAALRPSAAGAAVDWVGGLLLGLGLALVVLALYPDSPAERPVNAFFWPLLAGGLVAFGVYSYRSRPRLRRAPWTALAANLLAGVALMVVLVDVPVLARAVYSLDQAGAGLLLVRFLAGVPVGAVLGGLLAVRLGRRPVALFGLLLAAVAFLLMSRWGLNQLAVAGLATAWELFAAGLGFGLVAAPLSAAVVAEGAAGRGAAASRFVVARTLGMLLGLSGLTAFGLRRFYVILASLRVQPCGAGLRAQLTCLEDRVRLALLQEYQEIFLLAALVLMVAAGLAFVSLRPPAPAPPAAAPG